MSVTQAAGPIVRVGRSRSTVCVCVCVAVLGGVRVVTVVSGVRGTARDTGWCRH